MVNELKLRYIMLDFFPLRIPDIFIKLPGLFDVSVLFSRVSAFTTAPIICLDIIATATGY